MQTAPPPPECDTAPTTAEIISALRNAAGAEQAAALTRALLTARQGPATERRPLSRRAETADDGPQRAAAPCVTSA
jgi:hypothetical protein